MSSSLSRVSAATVAFWTAAVVTTASLGTLAAMTIFLLVSDSPAGPRMRGLTSAAAALDILSILGALTASVLFLLRVARKIQLVCCAGFAALALVTASITMYSLASTWNETRGDDERDVEVSTSAAVTQAGFAIWAVAAFSQVLLYAIILRPSKRRDGPDILRGELTARLHQVKSPKRSLSVRLTSLSSPRSSPDHPTLTDPTASHFSSPSLSPHPSFRRSFGHAIRPMTSKTRLLFRSSVTSRETPSLHSGANGSRENVRPQNEFRDWDTSGAIGSDDDAPQDAHYSRSTRTRLATIPGSRPVSPAKRLDGPFHPPDTDELPLPDSPLASPTLSRSEFGSMPTRPRAPSRPPSNNSQHEAHIHPLFRSESPVPPPLASPGTVITASPYAGQVVGSEQQFFPAPPRTLRSAHGSRPASPSPLSPVAPPARSRQSSLRSLRGQQPQPSSPAELPSPSTLSGDA